MRKRFRDRETWLAGRGVGIGASEAACAIGESPFMTPVKLWRLKTGIDEAPDLSSNPAVERGNRMEGAIRNLFAANHPEYKVEYNQFDIIFQKQRPWLFATLDGELVSKSNERGILEIKTAEPKGKSGWAVWNNGSIPQHYYIQILHQMLATGFDYAILCGLLYKQDGDMELVEREFLRTECQSDMEWLLAEETKFWKHVTDGTMPPMPINI